MYHIFHVRLLCISIWFQVTASMSSSYVPNPPGSPTKPLERMAISYFLSCMELTRTCIADVNIDLRAVSDSCYRVNLRSKSASIQAGLKYGRTLADCSLGATLIPSSDFPCVFSLKFLSKIRTVLIAYVLLSARSEHGVRRNTRHFTSVTKSGGFNRNMKIAGCIGNKARTGNDAHETRSPTPVDQSFTREGDCFA